MDVHANFVSSFSVVLEEQKQKYKEVFIEACRQVGFLCLLWNCIFVGSKYPGLGEICCIVSTGICGLSKYVDIGVLKPFDPLSIITIVRHLKLLLHYLRAKDITDQLSILTVLFLSTYLSGEKYTHQRRGVTYILVPLKCKSRVTPTSCSSSLSGTPVSQSNHFLL